MLKSNREKQSDNDLRLFMELGKLHSSEDMLYLHYELRIKERPPWKPSGTCSIDPISLFARARAKLIPACAPNTDGHFSRNEIEEKDGPAPVTTLQHAHETTENSNGKLESFLCQVAHEKWSHPKITL